MLKHWLIELIGHVSGLSDAQLRQIEKSLPASKALIDLLIRAEPMIEQAQKLYAEAEPLIDEAMNELRTVGPAMQILIDVIGHHVNKGSSPVEAAEAVRVALNGSIKSVAQDHWIDLQTGCVTVFGGTGFVGRRIVQYLSESGATVRVASRHPGRFGGDRVTQIAANAHDERSVEDAIAGADGVVNAISLHVEHGSDTFHSVHVEAAAEDRERSAASRGQTAGSFVGNRRRRGLAFAVHSQSGRRRGGRAGRIPWRGHHPPSGDVCVGRQLSHDNSQAASGVAGLSNIWQRQDEAAARVCG